MMEKKNAWASGKRAQVPHEKKLLNKKRKAPVGHYYHYHYYYYYSCLLI